MLLLWCRRRNSLPPFPLPAPWYPSLPTYHSSASPLSLPSVFEPNGDASIDEDSGSALADRQVSRAIATLINGQPFPWPTHLESALASLAPRLSQGIVVRALDLIRPPGAALRFFRWAQHRAALDDRAHFKVLQVLCRCHNLSLAMDYLLSLDSGVAGVVAGDARVLHDRFFNVLIRAYGRCGQVREAICLFRRMRQEFGISPSVFSFNSLLTVLLRRGRTRSAQKLFDEMLGPDGGQPAISPDVCTFNIIIRGLCLNSLVDEGFRFFKEMGRWGCEPDVLTYNSLIDGLCREGKVRIARNLLDGMRKKSSEINPTVVSYTTVIRGHCEKRQIEEAIELFQEMVSSGIKPSRITYNTLIKGLCEARRLDLIKEIMKQEMDDFKPDTCTFNTLITEHCNMGSIEEALKVFALMAGMKVKSDSATYSILIRKLCQSEDFDGAEALLDDLLEKEVLMRKGGCIPVMAAYNPIFEYLCSNGKTHKARQLFHLILSKGTIDLASCKTVILGHCREGCLHDGYVIMVEMLRRGLVPDEETYDALILGFLGKEDVFSARKTLEKMLDSGHRPKTVIFHSVLTALLKKGGTWSYEAFDLMVVMLERKIRQSIALSTEVVCTLFKSDLDDKAFEILRLLYGNGYGVKIEELIVFLSKSHKLVEAGKLLLFFIKQNQKLDVEVCSMVVRGLCKDTRVSEAFELFYELMEDKVSLDSSCLKELQVALETDKRLMEAKFVSQRTNRQLHAGTN